MCKKHMLARTLRPLLVGVFFFLSTLACNAFGSAVSEISTPEVEFQAPSDGSVVGLHQPVSITLSASNEQGIGDVELFIDGMKVHTESTVGETQDVVVFTYMWTPDSDGEHSLMAVAYSADSRPSQPSNIIVMVQPVSSDVGNPVSTSTPDSILESSLAYVQGQATERVNIRVGPGPYCDIIGHIETGTSINLMEWSADELWLQTDYLGIDQLGWVFEEPISILGDEDEIPKGNRTGCAGCGDGVCNLNETCDVCPIDCGECCGNAICEAQYGEDCATCEADCGACCGNGLCEPDRGEDCATCEADCGACCGNGLCEPDRGEDCATCEADCGNCCGDGLCEPSRGEDCDTCEADCGECVVEPECGNNIVEDGEVCDPPFSVCYDSDGFAGECSAACNACTGPY